MMETRDRLARLQEDRYWIELEQTGECKALDITYPSLVYRAWRKYGKIRAAEIGGYLCELINEDLDKLEWD